MGVRKSVQGLTAAETTDLRDAFTASYGLTDNHGFGFFAGVHGLPLPIDCQHGTILFLPWHRAYLYFFQRALTAALGRARDDQTVAVTLPWWDWSSQVAHTQGVPAAYQAADGATNPLAAGPVVLGAADLQLVRDNLPGAISDGADPVTLRDPDVPDELPR